MKLISTILIILAFLSCGEKKSESTNTNAIDLEDKNKIEDQNDSIEASDNSDHNDYPEMMENRKEYIKELDLFWLIDLEKSTNEKVGFISLSDIYLLNNHPDSLAIPNPEHVDESNLKYIKLNTTYRKRFLSKTNISETDSVFIYNYSTDKLLSFPVSKLNTVAYLNIYLDVNECPCSQSDYMIGFEVAKSNLTIIEKNFNEALVFIGKENPFMKGQMKAIRWKKIKNEIFPIERSNLTKVEKEYKHKNAVKGQAYLYETENYQIFIQDYTETNKSIDVLDRHLMVIDKSTLNVVNEVIFSDSEGTSVAPLNFGINNISYPDLTEQWVGKLFKDKPDVVFGFEWVSFGCPTINFVSQADKYVLINCDNRH